MTRIDRIGPRAGQLLAQRAEKWGNTLGDATHRESGSGLGRVRAERRLCGGSSRLARRCGRASGARVPHRPHRARNVVHVLRWWDRENELPIRVWVAEQDGGPPRWRPAQGSESVCVWDLDVIWHERQASVRTLLAKHPAPDADSAYLDDVLERDA